MFFRKRRGEPEDGGAAPRAARPAAREAVPPPGEPAIRLDNRGLQPPEPMVRILSALDRLRPGQVLEAHNDRRPMFLLPHLEERGFAYVMEQQPDGSVITRIWHRQDPATPAGPEQAAAAAAEAPAAASAPPALTAAGPSAGTAPAAAGGVEAGAGAPAAVQDAAPAAAGAGAAAGPEPLVLDVRPYFARGKEPFRDIMAAVGRLQPGQALVLINGFEPVPLYWVMKRKGFAHRTERMPDGAWRVTFWRPAGQGR